MSCINVIEIVSWTNMIIIKACRLKRGFLSQFPFENIGSLVHSLFFANKIALSASYLGDHQHHRYKKGLTIASLNVTGLRSDLDEVQSLIYDNWVHILTLNETKLPPEYPQEAHKNVGGYLQTRVDRTASGGGVALYVRDYI